MEKVKTIRNVDEETWIELKTLAVQHRLALGILLKKMIDSYKKNTRETWDKILNSGKILTDKEAEDLEKITRSMRKEKGWRI